MSSETKGGSDSDASGGSDTGSGVEASRHTNGCVDLTGDFRRALTRARVASGKSRAAADLLRARPPPSSWVRGSRHVLYDLSQLHDFMAEHTTGYLGMHRLGGTAHRADHAPLTDVQREQVDRHVFDTLQACSERIERLKRSISAASDKSGSVDGGGADSQPSAHVRLHREAVVASLYERVQGMASVLKHMREIRLQQAQASVRRLAQEDSSARHQRVAALPDSAAVPPASNAGLSWLSDDLQDLAAPDEEDALAFEAENLAMAEELDSHADAARQLERKLEEISQMVAFFATKVQEQDGEIEIIHDNAHTAQEHVRSGNEQLSQASEQSFFGRFAVLLFLILASAMLLFLDWYS